MLVQEFHIKVDLGFINALMLMLEGKPATERAEVSIPYSYMCSVFDSFIHITAAIFCFSSRNLNLI